jgi:phage gp29-like protein
MTKITKTEQNLLQEIAGVKNDITFPALAGAFRQLDPVLLARAGANGIHLYDDLLRDGHTLGAIQKRLLPILAKPWEVQPASDKLRDIKAAEEVTRQLKNLDFEKVCKNLLMAFVYGYSVSEVMWELQDGKYVATDVIDRDQIRFLVDGEYRIRLRTPENMFPGEVVDAPRKFIWHTFGERAHNPYGRGLGEPVWFMLHFKREMWKMWMEYGENFASPTTVVTMPEGGVSPELQQRAFALANSIRGNTGIAIPRDLEVKLLESNRNTAVEVYTSLREAANEEISMAILCESVTTSSGERASRAAVAEYADVTLALITSDSQMVNATLNRTLVKWISELNFPGATPPKLVREIAPEADLFKKAQTYQYMGSIGYRPKLSDVAEVFGGEWEEYSGTIGAKPGQPVSDTAVSGSDKSALDNETTP